MLVSTWMILVMTLEPRHGRGHVLAVPLHEPPERLEGLADPLNVLQLIIDQSAPGHGDPATEPRCTCRDAR